MDKHFTVAFPELEPDFVLSEKANGLVEYFSNVRKSMLEDFRSKEVAARQEYWEAVERARSEGRGDGFRRIVIS